MGPMLSSSSEERQPAWISARSLGCHDGRSLDEAPLGAPQQAEQGDIRLVADKIRFRLARNCPILRHWGGYSSDS